MINQLVENSSSDNINIKTNTNNNACNIVALNKNSNQHQIMWEDSDNAACRVGSRLHNALLSRLQEVFMSFFKSTTEACEVIMMIGPFPNANKKLKGDTTCKRDSVCPRIKYVSMIDGAGKEALASKVENQNIVPLDVVLAASNIIVCKNPDGNGDSANEKVEDVFRDLDIDGKLDVLRVLQILMHF